MNICVFGSANSTIDDNFKCQSYDLGHKLADLGHNIVFGAGSHGMMGAVARGAVENNGKVYGILPSWMDNFDEVFKECEDVIYTKGMDDRKELFLNHADLFIITPGGLGTLDEFFEFVSLKQLKRHKKPIIIYNMNNFYDDLIEMLNIMAEGNFISVPFRLYEVADNLDDVVKLIEESF